MLIDALLYHGEEAALEIRLNTVQADVTVIMEADHTFQGDPSMPSFIDEYFPDFNIDYQVFQLTPVPDPWLNESTCRNALGDYVVNAYKYKSGVVFLSDADEFVERELLDTFGGESPVSLPTKHHYYWTVDWEFVGGAYRAAPFVAPISALGKSTANVFRYGDLPSFKAGWEFSFLGGVHFAQVKFQSFAHSELNRPDVTDSDRLEKCIREGLDPSADRGIKLEPRLCNDPILPDWLLENQGWIHERNLSRFDWI